MFEKQLVVLNPKYNVIRKKSIFLITDNNEYVDLEQDDRLNFIALCGRNGVGKSTFLAMLSGRHNFEATYTMCWVDSAGELACTESAKLKMRDQKILLNSKVHPYKLSGLCGNRNLGEPGEENHVGRSLVRIYSMNPNLFSLHGKPVFDGFHLDRVTRVTDLYEIEKELAEHLGINFSASYGQFQKIVELHPTFHVLASIALDSTFKDICSKCSRSGVLTFELIYRKLRDKNSDSLDKEINEIIFTHGFRGDILEKNAKKVYSYQHPNWLKYKIKDYDAISRKLSDLSRRVDEWIRRRLAHIKDAKLQAEHLNLHIENDRLMDLVSFQPYKKFKNKICHLSDLSDGEYSQIKMLFDLGPFIMPEEVCWFYLDDVDDYLHPEWKRCLVNRISSTYKEFSNRIAKVTKNKRYTEKTLLCIVATHSPFVLSDLPRQNVLKFVKGDNGKTLISRSENNTFAGNIGELFHTEFFMDSTIGEFARCKIKKALKMLDESASEKDMEQIKKLFSMVGDDVLKNLLLDKVYNAENHSKPI